MTMNKDGVSELTRPIIGIENRTPQEVFDIMVDRFRAAERSGPTDSAEMLQERRAAYRRAPAVATEDGIEPHPLASWPDGLALGLHRVFWKSGGCSLCAVGMQHDGKRWLAPCNWLAPTMNAGASEWGEIERTELLFAYPEIEAALSVRAEPVVVKPLVWEQFTDRFGDLSTLTVVGSYTIRPVASTSTSRSKFRLWMPGVLYDDALYFDTIEEAKAAAQADYEQRIRSALVASPAEPAPAQQQEGDGE